MTPHQEFLTQRREIEGALIRFGNREVASDNELETDRDNLKTLAVEIVAALGHLVEAFGGERLDFMHDMSGTADTIDDAFAAAITARDTDRELREYERSQPTRQRYGWGDSRYDDMKHAAE